MLKVTLTVDGIVDRVEDGSDLADLDDGLGMFSIKLGGDVDHPSCCGLPNCDYGNEPAGVTAEDRSEVSPAICEMVALDARLERGYITSRDGIIRTSSFDVLHDGFAAVIGRVDPRDMPADWDNWYAYPLTVSRRADRLIKAGVPNVVRLLRGPNMWGSPINQYYNRLVLYLAPLSKSAPLVNWTSLGYTGCVGRYLDQLAPELGELGVEWRAVLRRLGSALPTVAERQWPARGDHDA